MIFTIALTLPFMSHTGWWIFGSKEGALANAGKHALEPAAQVLGSSMEASSQVLGTSMETSSAHLAESIDGLGETAKEIVHEQLVFYAVAIPVVAAGYAVHSAGWYAYHYANGSLEAELEKYKAEQERYRKESEEHKLKQLLAVQEATRLKRNAEIETEFNSCFANRFNSPTRRRNGIPTSCELQGMQLVSTGKFKSMQDLKNYYKS